MAHTSQAIHTNMKRGVEVTFFTFAYVIPNILAKARFWEDCKRVGGTLSIPWVVMGDMNDIASRDEQWGSETIKNANLDAYSSCGLIDSGHSGKKFTWCRTPGNRVIQMHRLDRVLWNVEAQLAFPEGKTVALPRFSSDHNPILFIDVASTPP